MDYVDAETVVKFNNKEAQFPPHPSEDGWQDDLTHVSERKRGGVSTAKILMTDEEKFIVDLQGYLVIKDVLTRDEVAEMNQTIDRGNLNGPPSLWGEPFKKLIDHPKILPYLIELLGPYVRLDHDYAIFMDGGESSPHQSRPKCDGLKHRPTTWHNPLSKLVMRCSSQRRLFTGQCRGVRSISDGRYSTSTVRVIQRGQETFTISASTAN